MKRSMANVCFFAVTGASLLSISLMTTVAEDEAELLKRAQELFQPLPKDMATPEFPVTKSAQIWGDEACLCVAFIIAGDVGFGRSGQERVRIGLARPHSRFAPEPGNLVSKSSLYRQDFCCSRFSPSGAVIGKRTNHRESNSVRI